MAVQGALSEGSTGFHSSKKLHLLWANSTYLPKPHPPPGTLHPLGKPRWATGGCCCPQLPTVLLPRSCRWWLPLTPSDVGDPTSPRHLGTWALGPLRQAGWEACPRTVCREVMKTAGGTPHSRPSLEAMRGQPGTKCRGESALGGHLGALAVSLEGTHCPVPGGWVGSREERTVTEPAPCGGAAVGGEGAASVGTE